MDPVYSAQDGRIQDRDDLPLIRHDERGYGNYPKPCVQQLSAPGGFIVLPGPSFVWLLLSSTAASLVHKALGSVVRW